MKGQKGMVLLIAGGELPWWSEQKKRRRASQRESQNWELAWWGNSGAVSSKGGSPSCHSFSDFVWFCSNQEPCLLSFIVILLLLYPAILCMDSDGGILYVHCAAFICRTSLLMPSGPCGLVGSGAFALIVPCLGLVPYSKQKYMDRPCNGFTKSYSSLRMARSHWGSNPLSEGITFPAKYVTWFSFKHVQSKSPSRQTFNSGLVPRTVMGDSSQHPT